MDPTLFFYLAMALVAVLTWVGQRFGWPILVMVAGWVKGMADKDGDGKPDPVTADAVQPVPLLGLSLSSVLVLLLPVLSSLAQQLIDRALRALTERLGRVPTPDEVSAETEAVLAKVKSGRVNVSLLDDEG
jgi:hypothetical protein